MDAIFKHSMLKKSVQQLVVKMCRNEQKLERYIINGEANFRTLRKTNCVLKFESNLKWGTPVRYQWHVYSATDQKSRMEKIESHLSYVKILRKNNGVKQQRKVFKR